jgi:hypothetical protein
VRVHPGQAFIFLHLNVFHLKMADSSPPQIATEQDIHVELTYDPLDIVSMTKFVKRDDAGAVVTFTGALLQLHDGQSTETLE